MTICFLHPKFFMSLNYVFLPSFMFYKTTWIAPNKPFKIKNSTNLYAYVSQPNVYFSLILYANAFLYLVLLYKPKPQLYIHLQQFGSLGACGFFFVRHTLCYL